MRSIPTKLASALSHRLALVFIASVFTLASPSLRAAKFTGEPDIQALPLSPEESMQRMRVEDGLQVELLAAEPLIRDPAEVAFDEAGRMFVAEITGTISRRVPARGRASVCSTTMTAMAGWIGLRPSRTISISRKGCCRRAAA